MTLYKYTDTTKGALNKLLNIMKGKNKKAIYVAFHILWVTFWGIISLFAIHSFFLSALVIVLMQVMGVYNGANFYIEYFSKKYLKTLQNPNYESSGSESSTSINYSNASTSAESLSNNKKTL